MTELELINQIKRYFGEDRTEFKKAILGINFNGKEHKAWKKFFVQVTNEHPFDVSFRMMNEEVKKITAKKYDEIDWDFIGDISWEVKILLNEHIKQGYDWDKKLCANCGGTARILRILISDIIPAFTCDVYSMTYSKMEGYYEFNPIQLATTKEKEILKQVVNKLKQKQYYFVSKKLANQKFKDVYSDCHSEGNASVFDVLFSDVDGYQTERVRYNDKLLKDSTGKEIRWREFYDKDGGLIKRLEYQYFKSKNVLLIETNKNEEIQKVTVWKNTNKQIHQEFKLKLP